MTEPIIFISRNRIAAGRSDAVITALGGAVRFIGASKPRTAVFAAYLDEPGATVSVVHVFADQTAMTDHFVGSDERSSSVSELITPTGFEVFGDAPDAAIQQLRTEASDGGAILNVHARAIGGFLRAAPS